MAVQRLPVMGKVGAWSITPDAATGDALSTAFMIMSPDEVAAYGAAHPGVRSLLIVPGEKEEQDQVIAAGPWGPKELVY